MTQVSVILWSNHANVSAEAQWDFGLLRLMFEDQVWGSPYEFVVSSELHPILGDFGDRAIFVVPARHHASPEDVMALNRDIAQFAGVVLMLIGDEEAEFPWRDIQHPNARFWVMHPDPVKHADMSQWAYFFGTGYKYDTPAHFQGTQMPPKNIAWAFAGQVTHPIRKQAANALKEYKTDHPGALVETEGFTQGLPRSVYLDLLMDARVAYCPSGPCTPDTFRFYEALEAGCLPVVDVGPPPVLGSVYWDFVYGTYPGPMVGSWTKETVRWASDDCELAQASAWWQQVKRGMVKRLEKDLEMIGFKRPSTSPQLTVIVTTSPIPSHPSMDFLEETLDSVWRNVGGDVQIIIACDGIRPQQESMRAQYDEYVRHVCWKAEHHWRNVLPVVSRNHRHQAGMTRMALDYVDTPVILFMEHDTPLSTAAEEPIDWQRCIDLMAHGHLDVLRFSHEASVHPEHEHLFIDKDVIGMAGVPMRRTVQWSARPHLARTAYYREVLDRFFPVGGSAFLEDKLYSVVQSDWTMQHRLAVYHPAGSIRRSFHTDGRAGGPKYEAEQIL